MNELTERLGYDSYFDYTKYNSSVGISIHDGYLNCGWYFLLYYE